MESDSDSQFSVVLEDGGNSGTEVGVGDEGTELVEEEGEENMDRGIREDSMAALEENQHVADEEQHLEDLNDVTSDLVLKKGIPTWARTVNYMAEAQNQEETGSDTIFSIFAPVNLNDLRLEESDIFKTAKTPKRLRNFSLELDLSSYQFDPADLLALI